jgi:hypothetical protein
MEQQSAAREAEMRRREEWDLRQPDETVVAPIALAPEPTGISLNGNGGSSSPRRLRWRLNLKLRRGKR